MKESNRLYREKNIKYNMTEVVHERSKFKDMNQRRIQRNI